MLLGTEPYIRRLCGSYLVQQAEEDVVEEEEETLWLPTALIP
jgi:hypothetical protein